MRISVVTYWLKRFILFCTITILLISCASHDNQLTGRWEETGTADLSGFIFIGPARRILVFSNDNTFTDSWRSIEGTWSTSGKEIERNDGRISKIFYTLIIKDNQGNTIIYPYKTNGDQLAIIDEGLSGVSGDTNQIIFKKMDK